MVMEVSDFNAISKGNVVLDFYTSACMPCKLLHPVLEEISNEFSSVKVARVNVANNPDMSQMFGIMSVPTVVFMKDSLVQHISHGFSSKENIKSMVKKYCFGS